MRVFKPENRNYTSWSWSDELSSPECDPVRDKLLVGDSLGDDDTIDYSSPYRRNNAIPGILVLDGSTYGRYGGRLLYKCVPSDSFLPVFLVPYSTKTVGFSKRNVNRYVLFRFVEWDDKHPIGSLTHTVGHVEDLCAFYQFQMHARGVYYSVQTLAKQVKRNLPVVIDESGMEDRRNWATIAIDPADCTDFDDAIGFRRLDNERSLVSVYIANVPVWLEALSAWPHLSEQAATIYLPDGKRSMLPSILSEKLCSLRAGEDKYVIAMDIEFESKDVKEIRFTQCVVRIQRNYVYDEPDLLEDSTYQALFEATKTLSQEETILNDSHDVVEVLMVMMNHEASKLLYKFQRGIFRNVQVEKGAFLEKHYDMLRSLGNAKGSYVTAEHHIGHQMMGLNTYLQITSPIRRLFDLVNMIELSDVCNIVNRTSSMITFVEETLASLEKLNDTMTKIKKVQNDCALLHYCCHHSSDELLTAYTLDEPGSIYIPALNCITHYEGGDSLIPPYSKVQVRLYVFVDEATLWRKVRVQIV